MDSAADTPCGVGCPIRRSRAQSLLAAPPGFSQRATSFVASWRQGIHQMPLLSSTPASDNRTTPASLATCRGPRPRRRTAPTKTGVSSGGRRRRKAIPATTTVPQSLVARRVALRRRGAKHTHARCAPCPKTERPRVGQERATCRDARRAHAAGRPDRSGSAMPVRRAPLIITTSRCPNSTSGTPSRAGGLAAGRRGSLPGGRARPGPREPAPSP